MSNRRINVTTQIDRDVWFRWKALCHSHEVPVERATELLIAEKLKELGIDVRERPVQTGPVKVEVL